MEIKKPNQSDMLRLDAQGNWYQGEYPILHERTCRYLHKHLIIMENGEFVYMGEDKPLPVVVDDVGFWIVKIEKTIAGFLITLTDESVELLNPETLWKVGDHTVYCLGKGGEVPIRFNKEPYLELARLIEQRGKKYVLVLGKKEFVIADKPPAFLEAKRKKAEAMAIKRTLEKKKKLARAGAKRSKAAAKMTGLKSATPAKKSASAKKPAPKKVMAKPAKKVVAKQKKKPAPAKKKTGKKK